LTLQVIEIDWLWHNSRAHRILFDFAVVFDQFVKPGLQCLLSGVKRTFAGAVGMSAKWQKQTSTITTKHGCNAPTAMTTYRQL
jgi:hypothetical protein